MVERVTGRRRLLAAIDRAPHTPESTRPSTPGTMAPFTKSDFIWLNGELVHWAEATINVSAHALQYGTGVFEGMRCYETPDGPAIFRLDAHIRRLFNSASFYEIGIPFSFDQLCT